METKKTLGSVSQMVRETSDESSVYGEFKKRLELRKITKN